MPRVAWVSLDRPNPESPFLLAFRDGMRALNWTDGREFVLDTWWADGSVDRVRTLIPEILASKPDVIVASSGAVRPLIDANVAQPVVFTLSADVVIAKVVESWTRPGVNRTGVSFFSLELVPKRIELMREAIPGLKRVAFVGWPPHSGELLELEAATTAADRLGLEHRYFGAHTPPELDAAFEAIAKWKADSILAFAGNMTTAHPDRFAAFSTRQRIPAVSAWAAFAERGNLMTYGPVLKESHTRLASFVDRILKGAKAADMPVERPTRFELVVNMKAAKALGITIPQSVLLRADRLIE
jgi:ABC-type uncharacterized transport system substrate-binding protein